MPCTSRAFEPSSSLHSRDAPSHSSELPSNPAPGDPPPPRQRPGHFCPRRHSAAGAVYQQRPHDLPLTTHVPGGHRWRWHSWMSLDLGARLKTSRSISLGCRKRHQQGHSRFHLGSLQLCHRVYSPGVFRVGKSSLSGGCWPSALAGTGCHRDGETRDFPRRPGPCHVGPERLPSPGNPLGSGRLCGAQPSLHLLVIDAVPEREPPPTPSPRDNLCCGAATFAVSRERMCSGVDGRRPRQRPEVPGHRRLPCCGPGAEPLPPCWEQNQRCPKSVYTWPRRAPSPPPRHCVRSDPHGCVCPQVGAEFGNEGALPAAHPRGEPC